MDAFAEHQKARRYELADSSEITAFLAAGSTGKRTETAVSSRIRVTQHESEMNVSIETRDQSHQGAVIHRNYIAR